MTVYVDTWRQRARVGSVDAAWSHMFAGPYDDLEELHDLAAKIGPSRDQGRRRSPGRAGGC